MDLGSTPGRASIARVVKLVDTRDLKSLAGNSVTVQVRPRAPITCTARFAQIAQSVEQRIENPRVGGSIPPRGTIIPP